MTIPAEQDHLNIIPANSMTVDIREMAIDDIAPVYHLGERLFTERSP